MVADPRTKVRAHRLRPLAGPRPLQLDADEHGTPHSLIFEGARRQVEAVQDRWRIDDEWWREVPLSRMYYELRLEGERVVTVYRDLSSGDVAAAAGDVWWLQRY